MNSRLLFAALCLFWGGNWLAMKLVVTQVPPLACAATRGLLCGMVMLVLAGPRPVWSLWRSAPWRVSAVSLLTSAVCYGGLYWGAVRLSAGLASIVSNALMPIGLLVFGYVFREDTITRRRLAGIALGIVGLALLFVRRSTGSVDHAAIAGLAAIVVGTLGYCLGSVWSRPLLRRATPMTVGSLQMLIGGAVMIPLSALVESPSAEQLAQLLLPIPLASMLWMSLVGGVAALVIYLRLIRDWGPTRAGMYAFVTPIVATGLGAVTLGERLGALEVAGAFVMLTAAALVLPSRREARSSMPDRSPEPSP